MNWFRIVKWLFQIIVTILLLYVTFKKLDITKLTAVYAGINKIVIIPVLFFLFSDMFLNSYRLVRLYRFYGIETRLMRVFVIRFYSLFFTLIFPFLGDVYKIQAFKNQYGASYGKNALVIFLDKLIHTFALALIVAPLWALNLIPADHNLNPILLGLLVILILLLIVVNQPNLFSKLFRKLGNLSKIFNKIHFQYVKRTAYFKEIIVNSGISIFRHCLMGILNLVIAYSIFSNFDFNIFLFLVIVFLIMIAQVIPLSIGGIGLREYIAVMIFPLIGISSESAFMIAFIISSIIILQGLMGGITYLVFQALKVKKN